MKIFIAGLMTIMSLSAYAQNLGEILDAAEADVLLKGKADAFLCAHLGARCGTFQDSEGKFTAKGKRDIRAYLRSIANSDEVSKETRELANAYSKRTAYF